MKTKAIRLHGEGDLRLDEIELPSIQPNEILAEIVSDSICMSSYKASTQGIRHKRIPNAIADEPIMIGHEFCGKILEVGATWKDQFTPGEKFSIQPALNDPSGPVGILSAPGYSYPHIGGNAQHVIIPPEVMKNNCLLPFKGEAFYLGSPLNPSPVLSVRFTPTTHHPGSYEHKMIIKGLSHYLRRRTHGLGAMTILFTAIEAQPSRCDRD